MTLPLARAVTAKFSDQSSFGQSSLVRDVFVGLDNSAPTYHPERLGAETAR
jgi:hypothetical protein